MPLNGIAIGIAMWEIISWIIGIKKPDPWLYYDAIHNKVITMKVTQNPECTCCSLNEKSILATGDYQPNLRMIKDINNKGDNLNKGRIIKKFPIQKYITNL